MNTIITQIEGEFTDLQLVERIKTFREQKAAAHKGLQNAEKALAKRLMEAGLSEKQIGDEIVVVTPQALTEFTLVGLAKLGNCTTDEQRLLVLKQLPNGKQLKELSAIAGAPAKSVIESAKTKTLTGKTLLKIKRPKKQRDVNIRRGGITPEGEDSTL